MFILHVKYKFDENFKDLLSYSKIFGERSFFFDTPTLHSLLPRTSSEWNLLPDHVKSAPSLDAFKAYLQDINIATLIRDSHYD